MSSIGMCRLRDCLVAAVFALTLPSIALADSICLQVLDAAGTGISIQCQVPFDPNDPTPIIIDLQSFGVGADLGAVQQVTLSGAPDAAGTAAISGNSLVVSTVSPPATLGLSSAPMIAVTIAVPDQAPAGTTASLTPDPAASASLAPFGAPCALDVSNPEGTGASYSPYLPTTDLGKSARPLLAATEVTFPVAKQSRALVAAPTSGTFFGLALQNPEPVESIVLVELWDTGLVAASALLALPPLTRVSREVSELFPGVIPSAGSFFRLTATVAVQMLGLSGNENDGSVMPVLPALACPGALDVWQAPAR